MLKVGTETVNELTYDTIVKCSLIINIIGLILI